MIPYLEIAAFSRGVRIVAGINDAPLVRNDPLGRDKQSRMPINWWLMPEGNLLTVRVEPLAGATDGPRIDIAMAFPEDEEPPLCRVAWGFPMAVDLAPFEIRLPFYPPKPARSRVWRDATILSTISPKQRIGAVNLAKALLAAFSTKDINTLMSLLDYRLEEMILAFEVNASAHRTTVRGDFDDMMKSPGFAMEPFDPETILMNPCCGGRIFQLTRADGSPLIATKPTATSAPTTMQVYVALIRDEWRIVRG